MDTAIRSLPMVANHVKRHTILVIASAALFALLLGIYVRSPITTSADSRWSVHTAMSFARGHWGDLSEYMDAIESDKDHAYTIDYSSGRPRNFYPIGVSILVVPEVVIKSWLDPNFQQELKGGIPDRFEKFLASIIGAGAGVVFFWLLIAQFESLWIAIAGTAIFSLGTSMWSTATRALWQHGPLVLMLTIAMLLAALARRRPQLVQYISIPLAMAYMIRPVAAVPILCFSVYVLLFHREWFLRYLGWALLIAAPWFVFNYTIYGALLPPYYLLASVINQSSFMDGFLGILFSPSRGLVIFTPVTIFALSGFALSLRRGEERALHVMYGVIVAGVTCLYGMWPVWWGGHSYGPRFMTDILPFLIFFVAFNFRLPAGVPRFARSLLAITIVVSAAIGSFIHGKGALRWAPHVWNSSPSNVDQNPARLWDWRDPQFLRTGG